MACINDLAYLLITIAAICLVTIITGIYYKWMNAYTLTFLLLFYIVLFAQIFV